MDRRVAELHVIAAREKALRIFALTSAVYPREWQHPVIETAFNDIFEYAFHARRLVEGCGLKGHKFRPIDTFLVSFSTPPVEPIETNFLYALNGLTHADEFVFGWAHADHRKIFLASEANLAPTYLVVTSDRFTERRTISLYGLIDAFLSELLPLIRERFPEYRF